jgi:hypothetical protein
LTDASSEASATTEASFCGVGALRQRSGGRFELGRRRRHRVHDVADRALELVGELLHVGLAAARAGDLLALRLLLLGQRLVRRILADHRDGLRHVADLVAAGGARHLDVEIALGHLVHRAVEPCDRPRDPEEREDDGAEQDQRHHAVENEADRPAMRGLHFDPA